MLLRLALFLVLNFLGLGIGGSFTGAGVTSDWYVNLHKAPWTPPGWVFGAAWTTIMVCYGIYLAKMWSDVEDKSQFKGFYGLQWVLNVIWNPIFFHYHSALPGMLVLLALTILVYFVLFRYWKRNWKVSLLLLPYAFWLLIACSLNGYILLNN